jgi:fimbrial chaperone protein
MTTKMGIPIFLRPVQATSQATLQDLNVKAGHFRFSLRNGGTVHFVPQTVRVHGLDEAGATVLDKEISGWYVLAGGLRVFDLELPAAQCARFRSFVVEVQVSGTTLKEALQTPAGTCGT